MKNFFLILLMGSMIVLASCGGAENKVDTGDTIRVNDTTQKNIPDEKVPAPEPETKTVPVESKGKNEKNTILANIDKYLVTTVSAPSGGGAGSITVENTLTNASFQRAIVEVSELNDAGVEQKTNFYTVLNLEPGFKKTVKIPSMPSGAKLSVHVVKAKSAELTGGEMILVGSRYSGK